jgi:hypothetical protein
MPAVDLFPHKQLNELTFIGKRGGDVRDEMIDGQDFASAFGAWIVLR